MGSRLDLHDILLALLNSNYVYYQPPSSFEMKYPCIVYKLDKFETEFASNKPYKIGKKYLVTVIDPNPDSSIPAKVAALPQCVHDQHYTADNLNHDVFVLSY